MKLVANLSGLAQVVGMAYAAYKGAIPEWLRYCFAVYVGLYVLVHVIASDE